MPGTRATFTVPIAPVGWVLVESVPRALPFVDMTATLGARRASNAIALLLRDAAAGGRTAGLRSVATSLARMRVGVTIGARRLALLGQLPVSWIVGCQLVLPARGQEVPAAAREAVPPAASEPWTFGLAAYSYSVPENRDYLQPTLTADRGWLHLEARYNYEDLDTGSLWFGANLAWGDALRLELTPMVGAVLGQTDGVAPGYRGTLSWWQLQLYSEGEYLFDTEDASASYFYTWSELTIAPTEHLRVGYSVQRTKVYETDFDIQRGFVVGIGVENVDLSLYVFNPDESRPTVLFGIGLSL